VESDYDIQLQQRASRDHLLANVALGIEIEAWLQSEVGRFIVARAAEVTEQFIAWTLSADSKPEQFAAKRAEALAARQALVWACEQVAEAQRIETQIRLNHSPALSE